MGVLDGRTWLEHLSEVTCWELLGRTEVGRLGVVVDGGPEIYPVNHAVDGRSIVFRFDPGTKLTALLAQPRVCYEVDGVDDRHKAWSVLVKGTAHEIRDAEETRRAADLPLRLWVPGDRTHWVRLRPVEVTGRRLHPTEL